MLAGQVCLVTGGSHGIGRGIALQLGSAGATVYVTGRSKDALESCCQEIKKRGGEGKPMVVDHSKEEEVERLFECISKEQQGKLDVLVNNAYAAVSILVKTSDKPFWDSPPAEMWDIVNNVGLRNHYICSVYAARLMVPRRSGLIVNVSSIGGLVHFFNVAYGVGKAACDKMASDSAQELKKYNVTFVSLWPGPVKTETIMETVMSNSKAQPTFKKLFEGGESLEFSGQAVKHLAADTEKIKKTGRILLTADMAHEYGFVDEEAGVITGDLRSVKGFLLREGWETVAMLVPEFIRVPHFILYFLGYKF